MELTPKVFRDVQFREKLRGGYHPEDVDEFLEQAAQAVEGLHEQLRQATDSAQRAQQAASAASETDDTLKRMLLIAQRTADQAVSEARQEADQSLSKARREAEQLLASARSQSESMLVDAEERGRKAYESGLAEGRASMERADEELRRARQEVEILRGWVDVHKGHLLSVLREAVGLVENTGLISEPPTVPGQEADAAGPADNGDRSSSTADGAAGAPAAPADAADLSEDATGEWDPHHLQGLELPAGDAETGAAPGDEAEVLQDDGADGPATASLAEDSYVRHGTADNPMELDERALDSFFSDQDMGDARGGLGRFRRRP